MGNSLRSHEIAVEHAGHTYYGSYYLAGPLLHVYSAYGSKSRELGSAIDAGRAAQMLLAKIVRRWTPPVRPATILKRAVTGTAS
jgi:hypothetical protein